MAHALVVAHTRPVAKTGITANNAPKERKATIAKRNPRSNLELRGLQLFRQKLSSVSDEVFDVACVSQVAVNAHHYTEHGSVGVECVVS